MDLPDHCSELSTVAELPHKSNAAELGEIHFRTVFGRKRPDDVKVVCHASQASAPEELTTAVGSDGGSSGKLEPKAAASRFEGEDDVWRSGENAPGPMQRSDL